LIYSQWLPDRGGYAHYETSERRGLGDDLPTPRLHQVSAIGVASTDIGRPLPLGAKIVGYGPLAQGSVVPMDRRGLSGIDLNDPLWLAYVGLGLVAAGVGFALGSRLRGAR
jgi:hypothetical protein